MAQNSFWLSLDREQQNNPITEAKAGEAAFGTRGHNAFWVDNGPSMGMVMGEYRTSWVIDPADGRIPYKEGALRFVEHLTCQKLVVLMALRLGLLVNVV